MAIEFTMDLRLLLAAAAVASAAPTRYYLNGVCLTATPGGLRVVATNGLALGAIFIPAANPDGHIGQWIISRMALCRLKKPTVKRGLHLPKPGSITIDGNKCTIDEGNCAITTNLIDGTFPDWPRLIPREMPSEGRQPYIGPKVYPLIEKFS